ncbi:MAG: DUF3592 domain-containing protein [Labedaea sp.]
MVVEQVVPAPSARREHIRRIVTRVLLAVGALITGLGVLLVVGAWTEDAKIDGHTGHAEANVVSVSLQRTLVRYQTPDGAEHIPSVGVLYPEGLSEGDTVRVEYDTREPELVRVAGRGVSLTLLPVGSTVLTSWLVIVPAVLWLRHRRVTPDRDFDSQV